MALNYEDRYPGQITPSNPNYPFGQAQNITIPGDGTGTPWEKDLVNDYFGFLQAVLDRVSATPNGVPDTAQNSQYLQSLQLASSNVFDSVSSMTTSAVSVGSTVTTQSYAAGWAATAGGATGGATYVIVSKSQHDTVRGSVTVDELGDHTMSDGNVALLVFDRSVTLTQFGADHTGVGNSTAALQALIDLVPDGTTVDTGPSSFVFTVGDIDYNKRLVWSGSGLIQGLAPSGTKPTITAISTAGTKGARESLLTGYYNSVFTISSGGVYLDGTLRLKDVLIDGNGTSFEVYGTLKSDNVSMFDSQLIIRAGHIFGENGLFSCDANGTGIYIVGGGSIVAANSFIGYATTRGLHIFGGGTAIMYNTSIDNNTSGGVYLAFEGTAILGGGTIRSNGSGVGLSAGGGLTINYGGSADINGATISNNNGSGVACESGGLTYAVLSTITNNNQNGIFLTYGAIVQAQGSTITGNSSFAVSCRSNSVCNVLTATIDLTNNSGGVQIQAVQGGFVHAERPGVGSGKTALNAASYDPPFNTTGQGGAWIGEDDPVAPDNEIGGIVFVRTDINISSGSITATVTRQGVDTEGFAATDDLVNVDINSTPDILYIFPTSETRTIVVKHGTGNIQMKSGADATLDTRNKGVMLVKANTIWLGEVLY